MENNAKGLMDGKTVSQDKKAAISVDDVKKCKICHLRGILDYPAYFERYSKYRTNHQIAHIHRR